MIFKNRVSEFGTQIFKFDVRMVVFQA